MQPYATNAASAVLTGYVQDMSGITGASLHLWVSTSFLNKIVFQRTGTFLYALALLVPPLYLVAAAYSLLVYVINKPPTVPFYVANFLSNLLFSVVLIAVALAATRISERLQD
jgi:hypothetical protein